MKRLHKYHCLGCNYDFPITDEIIRKCLDCGSTLIKEDKNLTAEDYLGFVEWELESLHRNASKIPRKLYDKLNFKNSDNPELARIICETFYDNI